MTEADKSQTVRIYGVPMDLGQGRRGVDMGPSALRYAELQHRLQQLDLQVFDGGNLQVPVAEEVEPRQVDGKAYRASVIGGIAQTIHDHAAAVLRTGEIAMFLGGDHSISIGTISAVLDSSVNGSDIGVLWIDAHADFNTPATTPSGNVHGMVVAALMGRCPPVLTIGETRLQPDQIVMIGIRDLDTEERLALRESGIYVLTMRDLDERGMAAVASDALNRLKDRRTLHVSLDMDAIDPQIAPGVGTPVSGGLNYREAHLLMEMLADDGRVQSLDIVEINPILDERNQTSELAVELATGLFGQRIL